jgi:hypothetical protein
LRDAQVLPIWEGTTNVLSLDVLRAIEKTSGFPAFVADARQRIVAIRGEALHASASRVAEALDALESFTEQIMEQGRDFAELHARAFSFAIARIACAVYLLEQAQWSLAAGQDAAAVPAAIRWCARELASLQTAEGPVPSPMVFG